MFIQGNVIRIYNHWVLIWLCKTYNSRVLI